MPIDFVCPSCFRSYSAPEDVAGRAMSCAGCSSSFNIPAVKLLALPPEPGTEPKTPAPPMPRPRVVVWSEPDEDTDADDEDEDYTAQRRARKRRKRDRDRAKFWFWVKLSLIIACLVGICVGIRVGLGRIDAVREHNQRIKGGVPNR